MVNLDAWLPDPDVRTVHRARADASPDALWDAAGRVRLSDTRTLGRLVRWRIPGTPPDMTFERLFAGEPFCVLATGERWSLSGLAGRIWTVRRDYPRLDGPDAWREWDRPGTVKVLFAHAVTDEATLISEVRVGAVDRHARLRLRAMWAAIGHFERLIGAEPLTLAARTAQAESAA